MNLNVFTLASNYNVLILEEVFPKEFLNEIIALCNTSEDAVNDWQSPDYSSKRKIYKGNSTAYQEVTDYLSSNQFIEPIEQVISKSMTFVEMALWADYPGFGTLLPHAEKSGQGQGQIFITKKEHSTNGTTIMNNNKKILFTMPYRNNFGWYMDDCTQIMHSRQFDTPPGYVRYSLIFWHNYNERKT